MITTNDETLYKKLLRLRTHGIIKDSDFLLENHGGWYYEMQELGFNYRITDIQAALGNSQLKKAHQRLKKRQKIAKRYNESFSNDEKIETPLIRKNVEHAFHLYVIQVEDRLGLYNYLKEHQIFTQVHYIPVHLQPYYQSFGWKENDFPVAEAYYENCLSLPMYPTLSEKEQDFVIEKVLEFFK